MVLFSQMFGRVTFGQTQPASDAFYPPTGQTVRISMKDMRLMGRNTQGVKLANLREGGYLVAIQKLEGCEN